MKLCKKCNESISCWAVIDGRKVNCSKRVYCFKCSPFGKRIMNPRDLDSLTKYCSKCKSIKTISEFRIRFRNDKTRRPSLHCWCNNCTNEECLFRLREFKKKCIAYKGGSCIKCGYSKYAGALDFHHRDPNQKDFSFSKARRKMWSSKIEKELDKCDLLCANCHRETHKETYIELKQIASVA